MSSFGPVGSTGQTLDPLEVARIVEVVAVGRGARVVGLTGGVFQNALLTERCVERLESAGIEVLTKAHDEDAAAEAG